MAQSHYDQLVTNWWTMAPNATDGAGYTLFALRGTEYFGSKYGASTSPHDTEPGPIDVDAGAPIGWKIGEEPGGALWLQFHNHPVTIEQGAPVSTVGGAKSYFRPQPDPTNQYVRFCYKVDGFEKWLGVPHEPPPNAAMAATVSPYEVDEYIDWVVEHHDDLPQGPQLWLQTWNPASRFSPLGFLHHVKSVVDHQDMQHTGPDYWNGLTASPPNTHQTYSELILLKVERWENAFTAATAEDRAAASAAMARAATHFYNAPGAGNNLDPKRPPEWSEIDDELGSGPYPG